MKRPTSASTRTFWILHPRIHRQPAEASGICHRRGQISVKMRSEPLNMGWGVLWEDRLNVSSWHGV